MHLVSPPASPWGRSLRRALVLLAVVAGLSPFLADALLPSVLPSQAAAEAAESRRLRDILTALQQRGVRILFSNRLVHDEMRVGALPTDEDLGSFLTALLRPHGLAVERQEGEIWVVVAARLAATTTLRGSVVLLDTGRPLADIQIYLAGRHVVDSDAEGRFEITVPVGPALVVEARSPGFVIAREDGLRASASVPLTITLALTPAPLTRDEIVVTPSLYKLLGEPQTSVAHLDREQVVSLPHLGDDPLRTLAWLPGTAATDQSAEMHIRGGVRGEVLVLLDGLELDRPFHLADLSVFSTIDAETIDHMTFMTGGFPVQYGDRMSGVIDLVSASPTSDRLALGLSTSHARVQVARPLLGEQGRWLASARLGYLALITELTSEESEDAVAPTFFDIQGKIERDLGPSHALSGHIFIARDNFDEGDDSEFLISEHRNEYLWVNLLDTWSARLLSTTRLSAGQLRRDRSQVDVIVGPVLMVEDQRQIDRWGLQQDWHRVPSSKHEIKWGIETRRAEAHYDFASHAVVRFPFLSGVLGRPEGIAIDRARRLSVAGWKRALYLSDTIRADDSLTLSLGLRWDEQTYTGHESQLSPRLNAHYALGPRTALRAGWGLFHESQGIHELQVGDGENAFYPAQLSEHRILALEHRFVGAGRGGAAGRLLAGLGLRVEIYSKAISEVRPRYENLFDLFHFVAEPQADRVRIAPEKARSEGVEITLRKPGERLGGWLSYSLARAEDRVDGRWIPRSWDQRHTLRGSLDLRRGAWRLNLSGHYHSGWPRSRIFGSFVLREDGTPRIVLEAEERNQARLRDFFRLDLRISRVWKLVRGGDLMAYFEIANLLDRKNICCLGAPVDFVQHGDNRFELVQATSGVPILPSVGVSWRR